MRRILDAIAQWADGVGQMNATRRDGLRAQLAEFTAAAVLPGRGGTGRGWGMIVAGVGLVGGWMGAWGGIVFGDVILRERVRERVRERMVVGVLWAVDAGLLYLMGWGEYMSFGKYVVCVLWLADGGVAVGIGRDLMVGILGVESEEEKGGVWGLGWWAGESAGYGC